MARITEQATSKCKGCGKPIKKKEGYCWVCICKAEEEAYCPHGCLVGCPICLAKLQEQDVQSNE